MKGLTQKQKDILYWIADFVKQNAYPPTVREISVNFGITIRAVQDHLTALQKKGYIVQAQGRSRSLRVIKDERNLNGEIQQIPVLDTSLQNTTEVLNIALPFLKSENTYFAIKLPEPQAEFWIGKDDLAIFSYTDDDTQFTQDSLVLTEQTGTKIVKYSQGAVVKGLLAGIVRTC